MSNQSVQTVSTSNDKFKIALAAVAAIAGLVAFFYLAKQPSYMRVGALVAGFVLGALLLWTSTSGREFLNFAKEAVRETKKVVWPKPREAGQITLIVFAFVSVMAIFLWGTDQLIQFVLYDLILGWK